MLVETIELCKAFSYALSTSDLCKNFGGQGEGNGIISIFVDKMSLSNENNHQVNGRAKIKSSLLTPGSLCPFLF